VLGALFEKGLVPAFAAPMGTTDSDGLEVEGEEVAAGLMTTVEPEAFDAEETAKHEALAPWPTVRGPLHASLPSESSTETSTCLPAGKTLFVQETKVSLRSPRSASGVPQGS